MLRTVLWKMVVSTLVERIGSVETGMEQKSQVSLVLSTAQAVLAKRTQKLHSIK